MNLDLIIAIIESKKETLLTSTWANCVHATGEAQREILNQDNNSGFKSITGYVILNDELKKKVDKKVEGLGFQVQTKEING